MTPAQAHVAALAALPHLGPRGLRLLLRHHDAVTAFEIATARRVSTVAATATFVAGSRQAHAWHNVPADLPATMARRCTELGVRVLLPSDDDFPEVIAEDPQAPAALFVQGRLEVLERRRVGVVGTRHATATGRATAIELGRGLAELDVAVVSGLARGIDGAVHRAVVDAGGVPIGVIASGHDVVYPREHAALWSAVADRGLLVSELPPGCRPEGYRFPLRNRILAMLSEVLVVVESRGSGGSLITADEAVRRGRLVMAVPGSVRNPAAQGTNDLIADGATPVRDLGDVVMALGLERRVVGTTVISRNLDGLDQAIDRCLIDGGRCLDDLVRLTGAPLVDVMHSVVRLRNAGLVEEHDGWFERGHAPWGRP
jgi:DNA processing protein